MQQRQHHGQQRALLAAVQSRGGGEQRRGLAGQRALEPQAGGGVEEVLQRGSHVPEPRRAAHRQPDALLEVGELGVGCAAVGDGRLDRLAHRGHGRHGAQACACARHRIDPASDRLRHLPHRAGAAVVQNQDVCHQLEIERGEDVRTVRHTARASLLSFPARAGIQRPTRVPLDPGFRRDDERAVGHFRNAQ